MITKQLRVETYNAEGLQFNIGDARNLRVGKAFAGGEDMTCSFDLDRDARIDYRDIQYGNPVMLRRGLNTVWKGAMRNITQGEEAISIGCAGQWSYLDDVNHGGQTRIWCESRYKKWVEMHNERGWGGGYSPQMYSLDNNERLYYAPRKGETFRSGIGLDEGSQWYFVDKLLVSTVYAIDRISWDYDVILPSDWTFECWYYGLGNAMQWQVQGVTQSGVKDVTLPGPAYAMEFRMYKATGPSTYAGDTGIDCYAIVTNLRMWGQTTESPSVIHVVEDVVGEQPATSPIDANTDDVLDLMPARDYFTDPNGTLLANHLPDKNALRGAWTIDLGGFDIQANQANNTVAGSRGVIDSGLSDCVVCADVTTPGAGNWEIGIIFRRTDANNWWAWRVVSTGAWQLRRVIGGAGVTVATANPGIQAGYTYHLMVKLRGDEIRCYIGGILRNTTNDANHQASTWHGLFSAQQANMRYDNFEVYEAHPLWPLFYEDGESGYQASRDAASFGDWNYKTLGWGIRTGQDRAFVRDAERDSVRYVIPRQFCRVLSSRGETQRDFHTSGWAKYYDEEGLQRFTDKYYVHVTNDGLVVNTTATGNDLASTIYNIDRDNTFDFGRVDAELAVEYLIKALQEQGHPQVKSTVDVYGPVQDLHRGGTWIEPVEMEMGYLVRIPWFRATEATGVAGSDLRDWDTTFLMVGLEVDHENGVSRLIPEGAQEDLARMIRASRAVVEEDEKRLANKRSRPIGG